MSLISVLNKRGKMFSKIFTILAVMVGISSSSAINLQKFHFSNNPVYATVEDALLEEGHVTTDYKFILVGSYNYVRAPFIEVNESDRSDTIIDWMHTFNLGGAYKFNKNFQVGISTFFTYEKAIPAGEDSDHEKEFVMGDTTVDFKYKFYEKNKFAIAFTPRIYLNTGDEDLYTSNDEIGYYLGFALEKAFKSFQLAINLGHKENRGALYKEVDHRKQFHFSAGALIPLVRDLDLTAEFFRDTPYDNEIDQTPTELDVGIRYTASNESAVFAGIGTGSLDEEDSTDLRVYAGYKYYPSAKKKSEKVKKEEKTFGKFYKFLNIYFDTGVSKVSETESIKLNQMVNFIKNDSSISKIVIEGYTSKVGSASLNKRLSDKRIKSVVDYITSEGVENNIIQQVSYGDSQADDEVKNKTTDRKVMFRIYRTR